MDNKIIVQFRLQNSTTEGTSISVSGRKMTHDDFWKLRERVLLVMRGMQEHDVVCVTVRVKVDGVGSSYKYESYEEFFKGLRSIEVDYLK